MEGLLYCTINIFCLAILGTILGRIIRSSDKRVSQVTYSWFIISSIILCASDLLWGIIDYSYNWQFSEYFDFSVNSVYHVFTIVVAYLWFLYEMVFPFSGRIALKQVTTKAISFSKSIQPTSLSKDFNK